VELQKYQMPSLHMWADSALTDKGSAAGSADYPYSVEGVEHLHLELVGHEQQHLILLFHH
jgi:hypothetical protein